MLKDPRIKVFDGDYEIIFSENFNLYDNKLIITDLGGFKFEFNFEKSDPTKTGRVTVRPDNEKKTIFVTLENFRNQLGTSTSKKIQVANFADGKTMYMSIYGKSIGEGEFLNVTVSFYAR